MSFDQFKGAYERYFAALQEAKSKEEVEQERKRLFFDFVKEAFGLQFENYKTEKRVRLQDGKRGFVDALLGGLVFEFKQDLSKKRSENQVQLQKYLTSEELKDEKLLGIITDGLKFEAYRRSDSTEPFATFELLPDKPEEAYYRLDSYLFTQKQQTPTAQDLVFRFGLESPTFRAFFGELQALLGEVKYKGLAVWREQWDKLLTKVYGDRVEGSQGDELYLKHTFLAQFAKLLAYSALEGNLEPDNKRIAEILNGKAFEKYGVANIAENDFFSWVLLDEVKDKALKLFRDLARLLVVYDLSQIDQDLLKQLYQNLVDPSNRHDLGEYYTPDWLAELVLEQIDYHAPQSLLDPTCGSGTFLFSALQRLQAKGLTGKALLDFAFDNVVGMDVHPLAVTVARLNYVLALSPALKEGGRGRLFAVPIYLADALVERGQNLVDKDAFLVPVDESNAFRIPLNMAKQAQNYTEIINKLEYFAKEIAREDDLRTRKGFLDYITTTTALVQGGSSDVRGTLWGNNLTLLTRLIREEKNGIWAYILKNQARPLMLAERQFDVIVGNPPWLSYRYIKNAAYQKTVKNLVFKHGLLESKDQKLFTQMDLATLFTVHAESVYLREGGALAFVMPRSILTGARQHRLFQARGFSRVLDFADVSPLFNVPTCVIILNGTGRNKQNIPRTCYTGKLSAHEMSLAQARLALKEIERPIAAFADSEVRSPYYHPLFMEGATLVPRNLCFVRPKGAIFETHPDADEAAKAPYKGLHLEGFIHPDYLYATLLSKHLLPFGVQRYHLVALPLVLEEGRLRLLTTKADFIAHKAQFESWDGWFGPASQHWQTLSKGTISFFDQVNYRNKITSQRPLEGYRVVYNASGTNLAACVLPPQAPTVEDCEAQALVIDYTTYFFSTEDADEAHYLCALLNAPAVDAAIKRYQSAGTFGERHIVRAPFEAVAIPPYAPADEKHRALARLSRQAHARVAATPIEGKVVAARREARRRVEDLLPQIDALVVQVAGAYGL